MTLRMCKTRCSLAVPLNSTRSDVNEPSIPWTSCSSYDGFAALRHCRSQLPSCRRLGSKNKDVYEAGDASVDFYSNDGRLLNHFKGKQTDPQSFPGLGSAATIQAKLKESFGANANVSVSAAVDLETVRRKLLKLTRRPGTKLKFDMTVHVIDALLAPSEEFHDRIAELPIDREKSFVPPDEYGVARTVSSFRIKGVEKIRITRAIDESDIPAFIPSVAEVEAEPISEGEAASDELNAEHVSAPVDSMTQEELIIMAEDHIAAATVMQYEGEQAEIAWEADELEWIEWCSMEENFGACITYEQQDAPVLEGDSYSGSESVVQDVCYAPRATRSSWLGAFHVNVALIFVGCVALILVPPVGAAAIAAASVGMTGALGTAVISGNAAYQWDEALRDCRALARV